MENTTLAKQMSAARTDYVNQDSYRKGYEQAIKSILHYLSEEIKEMEAYEVDAPKRQKSIFRHQGMALRGFKRYLLDMFCSFAIPSTKEGE